MDRTPYPNAEKKIMDSESLHGITWLSGNASCLLILPKLLAKQYGIDQPSNVIIEGRPEGILIRKLQLRSDILYGSMKEAHETGEYAIKKSLRSIQVRGRGEIAAVEDTPVGADAIR